MFDSHCHINDDAFFTNFVTYIEEAKNAGIAGFLCVGFNEKSSEKAVYLSKKRHEIFAAVGIHPSDVKKAKSCDLSMIEKMLQKNEAICVGEIGLDYYWDKDEKVQQEQQEFFIKQIDLANKYKKPVSIHCRDAYEDCLKILKEHPVECGGIMHCYAGSKEMAPQFIKLGFVLGFGGTLTFKNSVRPKEVIQAISDNDYVLETDAPYLAPAPFRGKQNHPKYLYLVRNKISELRGISIEEVEKHSNANVKRILKI